MKPNHLKSQQKRRILVVDDEPELVELLISRLVSLGYEVDYAHHAMAGLEKVKTFNPELILLDIVMPEIDGLEFSHRLQGDEKTAQIPIVIITALQSKDLMVKIKNAGIGHFLLKPFDDDDLVSLVKSIIPMADSMPLAQAGY